LGGSELGAVIFRGVESLIDRCELSLQLRRRRQLAWILAHSPQKLGPTTGELLLSAYELRSSLGQSRPRLRDIGDGHGANVEF